ncbi:MAG: hypothetical protein H0T92_07285 [Pyrinomonadaceae bacterium]|nr:hypothetical protein [Pyrinomonadaceae bacterium]
MRDTILSVIVVLILVGALTVAAFVGTSLVGVFSLGVPVEDGKVMRQMESSELAMVLIAAVTVAAAALVTLRRLRIK